ncbi:MAG TPA: hypothetical protein VGG35_23505 [Streptosporangiaceae bacterium]
MADDSQPDGGPQAPDSSQARPAAGRSADARYARQNLAGRLFPGPSRGMSRQRADHIGRLLRPLDSSMPQAAWPDQQARTGDGSRPGRAAPRPPAAVISIVAVVTAS